MDNIDPTDEGDVAAAQSELTGLGAGSMGALAANLSKVINPRDVWNWGKRKLTTKTGRETAEGELEELERQHKALYAEEMKLPIKSKMTPETTRKEKELQEARAALRSRMDEVIGKFKNEELDTAADLPRYYKEGEEKLLRYIKPFGQEYGQTSARTLARGTGLDAAHSRKAK